MECKSSCDLYRRFQAARVAELGQGKERKNIRQLEVVKEP